MPDRNDYDGAAEMERGLREAVSQTPRTRPAVALGGLPSGNKPDAQDSATFSHVMQGMEELQKRLQQARAQALEIEGLLCGPGSPNALNNAPKALPEGTPVFNRLAAEMVVQAQELEWLSRSLDRALGALR